MTSASTLRLCVLFALGISACTTNDKHQAADAGSDATASDGLAQDATGTSADVVTVTPTFKEACKTEGDCGTGAGCVDGVCVSKPTPAQVAVISDPDNDNLPATEPISLGCVGKSVEDEIKGLTGPTTVTMWGRVDRFGAGPLTADVEVAVFKLADFHPEACAGISDTDLQDACYASDKVGQPLAKAVSVDPDKAAAVGLDVKSKVKAGEQCEKHLDCPGGYECRKDSANGGKTCAALHGVYAVENVPTNTRLVLRVRKTKPNADWHDSYLWDIMLFSNNVDDPKGLQPSKYVGKDTYRVNPTIVGQGQWELVPHTMGFDDIQDGHGVIGGRIRDCGTDKRGGWAIHNARIGIGVPGQGLAYFNNEEDAPVPDKLVSATDALGRYAAVDIPGGANRVASSVLIDGKVVPLGHQDVYVVPNALMIVSLPGREPVLNK
jgi:hypothetical protein